MDYPQQFINDLERQLREHRSRQREHDAAKPVSPWPVERPSNEDDELPLSREEARKVAQCRLPTGDRRRKWAVLVDGIPHSFHRRERALRKALEVVGFDPRLVIDVVNYNTKQAIFHHEIPFAEQKSRLGPRVRRDWAT